MTRPGPARITTLALLLAGAMSAAAAASLPDPRTALSQGPAAGQAELTVPRPELGAMEKPARRKIEAMQERLEELLARPEVPPAELAEAFGNLGRMFHAFRLLAAAADAYRSARVLQPDDHRWAYLLGLALNASGDFATALAEYEAALALRPDDFPTLIRLGNALLELDRGDEARARFERAEEVNPGSAAALYGVGRALVLAGDHAGAAERFERVLALQPEASVVHYPLGQAYRRLGDMEKARENLGLRGKQDVRFPDPLGNQIARLAKGTALDIVVAIAGDRESFSDEEFLGFALSQFGEVEGAAGQVRQWLELQQNPAAEPASPVELARLRYLLGGLLVNEGRDEEAMPEFRAAAELDPELIDARVKLGNAIARSGRLEEAAAEYTAVLERQPGHSGALLKRAAAWMALERDGDALGDLNRLVEIEPENSEAQLRLAAVLARSGQPEAAIDRYRLAGELDLSATERVQLHDQLGRLLRQRGDLAAALAEFRAALEVDPEFVPSLSALAGHLAQRGQFAEAVTHYRRWAELEPKNLIPRAAEATALILSGRYAEARDRLEAALEALPGELQLEDLLARHLAACPDPAIRDGERALELALRVFDRLPTPESAETAAMAYAQSGQFDKAAELQQELLAQAEEEGAGAADLSRLRGNLELYRQRRPCCAP